MNVRIQNYRGCQSASLDISKICLLAGPNEAGKTSASQAVAAALTGEAIPIVGVKKTQAGMLVRAGNANGSVELVTESGSTNIQWPSAKVKTEGQAPFASHFAAGLSTIAPGMPGSLDDKERVKVLTEYLKASPVRAELDSQLAFMELPAAMLDQLWKLIETQGWDGAAAQIKEKGARLKGQWQQATGEQYGSKKAESWIPEGYDNGLMGQSEDTLKAIVTDARDALEAALKTDAVDESKRMDLDALAAQLDARREALEAARAETLDRSAHMQIQECQEHIDHLTAKRAELDAARAELPQPDTTFTVPCPACGAHLELMPGKKLSVAVPVDDAVNHARQTAIDESTDKVKSVQSAISDHMAALAKLKARVSEFDQNKARNVGISEQAFKQSQSAADELKQMGAVTSGNQAEVESHRQTLATAETRLKAFCQKHEADRLHVAIGQNAELLAKIAPEGIRGYVLIKALKSFNDSLEPIFKAAGWRPVTLESDFMPTYGGTIYLLLSESAKFRVRVVLQIGMALLDKSQALIIDAADILDKGGRNGLFKAVKQCGLSTLVSMTIDAKELVPNLGKAGIGASYWLNGEAHAEAI